MSKLAVKVLGKNINMLLKSNRAYYMLILDLYILMIIISNNQCRYIQDLQLDFKKNHTIIA